MGGVSGTLKMRLSMIWVLASVMVMVDGMAQAQGNISTATEYHVSINGKDTNDGSAKNPLLTIQRAADLAQPGDTITVHKGLYRERVNPPRGGTSDEKRIVYQAAPGEKVVITGSELVTGWKRSNGYWNG